MNATRLSGFIELLPRGRSPCRRLPAELRTLPTRPSAACIRCIWLLEVLQQTWMRTVGGIRHEARQALLPVWISTRSECAKMASPLATLNVPTTALSTERQEPCLPFCLEAHVLAGRQIDPFEHEVGIGNEKRPFDR